MADKHTFESQLRPVPDGKAGGGYLEIGEFDKQTDKYPWEGYVEFLVAPNGTVWAKVAQSVDELPEATP